MTEERVGEAYELGEQLTVVGHKLGVGGALSSHRSKDFGRSYGILVKEWRMLKRAVFVLEAGRRIVHVEYVDDQMSEPGYPAAVEAVRSAAR